jgi:hypothetical protein
MESRFHRGNPLSVILTVAGNGLFGFAGDGGPAARLKPVLEALHAVRLGEGQLAFRYLMAFLDAVEAQRGGELSGAHADLLVARASLISVILTQELRG